MSTQIVVKRQKRQEKSEALVASGLTKFFILTEVWKAVGCYQNRGRALGETVRDVGSQKGLNKKLNDCKETAGQKGITVFGLDDKICWSGQNAANTYDMFGASGQCKTNKRGNSMGYFASESIAVYKKDNNGRFQPQN